MILRWLIYGFMGVCLSLVGGEAVEAQTDSSNCKWVCTKGKYCFRVRRCYRKKFCYPLEICRIDKHYKTDEQGKQVVLHKKSCNKETICTHRLQCKFYRHCNEKPRCHQVCGGDTANMLSPKKDPGTAAQGSSSTTQGKDAAKPTPRRVQVVVVPEPRRVNSRRPASRQPTPRREAGTTCGMSTEEWRLWALINQTRHENKVTPLRCSTALVQAARARSQACSVKQVGRKLLWERIQSAGVFPKVIKENLAQKERAQEVFLSWQKGSTAYQNILNPSLTHVGIGVASCPNENVWTITMVQQ